MTINNATVEQINVALLDIDKRIKALNIDSETLKSLQDSVRTIKGSLKESQVGLTSGETYDINISGKAATADKAISADISKTEDPVNGDELQIGSGTSQHITNAKHAATADKATTADKAVEVVDCNDTSRTVKVGFSGPSVTVDKLEYLAGYTDNSNGSIKIKDVKRADIIKWLGMPTIRYADYRTEDYKFTSLTDSKKLELSCFGSDVKEGNVLSFMVIYWSNVPIIAQADWAKSQGTGSSGLACRLYPLDLFNADTGYCVVRCVYLDIPYNTIY